LPPVVLVRIFWFACGPELAKTLLVGLKVIALVPAALAVNVTVATSIETDPPPPVVEAATLNAFDEVTLLYWRTLAL
jgi:hypothetical protein